MTTTDWQHAGHYFSYRDHRIFYRREGDGPPLLLIHGFPTAGWDWHLIWQPLTRHFELIAPDMIGFGFSDKPRAYEYSIMDQADLHEALMEHLGLSQVHVLAHDYGDTVAQELLARQLSIEEQFIMDSVCFLNGGLFPDAHRPRPIQRLLMSPLGPYLTPFLGRNSLARTFRRIFGPDTQPTDADLDHFWQLVDQQDGKQVIPRLIHYMAEREKYETRWVGALERSNIPMRLIDGAADPISGAHMAARYREAVPKADVVLLENIGHYPQVEAPEAVVQHYLAFRGKSAG